MSSIAGAATGCDRSLVDQSTPIVRRSDSSPAPGHVLDVVCNGPACRPRVRFFCISESLAMHCVAQVIGKECANDDILERRASNCAKEASADAL